jgi:hypothetical protein
VGAVGAAALALGSWAVIGFDGLRSYPDLLRKLSLYEEDQGYSLSGTLRVLGVGVTPARLLAAFVALALLGGAVVYARRRDDRRCFTATVLASLAATPILWQHYLVLMLVIVALARPRLSVVWFLPILMWVSPFVGNGSAGQTLFVPLVAAVVAAICLFPDGAVRIVLQKQRRGATHALAG